jgi:formate hydrogenlyase subunit 3/multisubunit Na+/H+ antiporter MnhD subunit
MNNIFLDDSYITVVTAIIAIPILGGIILFLLPERIKTVKGIISLIISAPVFYFAYDIFARKNFMGKANILDGITINSQTINTWFEGISKYTTINIDSLSKLITLLIGFFGFIIVIYSLVYINRARGIRNYYPYVLITLGSSFGAVLADNLLLFLVFWGILAVTCYKLIKGYDEESSAAANKTLVIIGASDGIMLLGIGIIWKITGSINMSELSINTTDALRNIAFISLLIASFTKAGAIPFHTWIPDYVKKAPASSSAYLPASLDKLLGIYFLARICNDIFILNQWLTLSIIIIGVLTIIIAVMMALVQHNYKKLLGYHAVSQVGYMVTGLGLGTPLGIIGGLFHMINNALYKSGLFLVAGSIEKRTGKEDLNDISGLSKAMPLTFLTGLVFALSISGIPPFNGFASKWTIYQGIIDFGKAPGAANQLWIIWLSLAVIGSALTLASFIKFISGAFLGRRREELKDVKEVSFMMWFPKVLLALICIGFGVFATNLVIPEIFAPIAGDFQYIGSWNSTTVSFLVLISIILGIFIYLAGNLKNFRIADSFIGGEKIQEETGYSSTEFYKTISNFNIFSFFYKKAEQSWFDIYYISRNIILKLNNKFSLAHNGIVSNYAIWVLAGLILMLFFLIF